MRFHGFLILSVLLSTSLLAINYDYSEHSPFYLGNGLNPAELAAVHLPCIKYEQERRIDGAGTTNLRLKIKSVKSQKELFNELGVSASVAAQSYFAGGEASASYINKTGFFEDSLTLLIVGTVSFGRFSMVAPALIEPFAQMLAAGNHTEFAKRCGTHFIAYERRGSTVFAIYTLHSLTQSQRTAIEAHVKAQGSLGAWSGKGSVDMNAAFGQAAMSSQIEFDLVATGGGGLQIISNIVKDPTNVTEVKEKISEYLNSMNLENAVPTGYMAASMSVFGWNEPTPLDQVKRDRVLTESYFLINDLEHTRTRLYGILANRKTAFAFLSNEEIADYRNARSERTKILESVIEGANACYRNTESCKLPNYEIDPIEWPTEKLDRCEILRVRAFEFGIIDAAKLENLRRSELVPIIDEESKDLIHLMTCKEFLNKKGVAK